MYIGDSLLQDLKEDYVDIFPGLTLERYINNFMTCYDRDEFIIICFGINDLNTGTSENELINMYRTLTLYYRNMYIVLPPFQAKDFYMKCTKINNTHLLTAFINDYETIDGLHPTKRSLNNLVYEVNNIV